MGYHTASLSDCVFGLLHDGVWRIFRVCNDDSLLRSNSNDSQGEKAEEQAGGEQELHVSGRARRTCKGGTSEGVEVLDYSAFRELC